MGSAQFIEEHGDLQSFIDEEPEVPDFELPICMQLDIVEMKFSRGVYDAFVNENKEDIGKRYASICLDECALLKVKEALMD